MILVTLGTERFPFGRLIAALSTLPDDELVVQHGYSPLPARAARAVRFLPFEELQRLVLDASAVVTHAGVGSVLLALRAGHTPIVVPRLRRLHEHVDGHQTQLARALEALGRVRVVRDVRDLAQAVAEAPARRPVDADVPCELATAVHNRLWHERPVLVASEPTMLEVSPR